MKKFMYPLLLLLSLVGCKGGKQINQLAQERDSLTMLLGQKDSMMTDVFTSINTISENLDAIRTREKIVAQRTEGGEIKKNTTAKINEDIDAINQLLDENRQTIARLERSVAALKQANVKVASLEKTIAQLNRQVEEKDQQIAVLRANLQSMESRVGELSEEVSGLSTTVTGLRVEREVLGEEVKATNEALNTVYYIVGSEKELMNKEIVYKRGFIGRTMRINESRNLDNFTRIDLRQLDEVLIGQKKATLVSSHPTGSYSWEMNSDGTFASLKIADKSKFWEYSKVLVISYK